MRVIIKHPGHDPYVDDIKNELFEFQKLVGGFIEIYRINREYGFVCNEEGLINGLPGNFEINKEVICGTVVFCRFVMTNDGEDFTDLTDKDVNEILNGFGIKA